MSAEKGWRTAAPAKINLGLFLGPTRSDGRHALVSVMQSISLSDLVSLAPRGPDSQDRADVVHCPGVPGPNLALDAVAAFRAATGWDAPPQRLTIAKYVPVAAGLGGGSGDAAAALRLCARAAGRGEDRLLELAAGLGADVPAQVTPGRSLASGAGEILQPLTDGPPLGVVVVPSAQGLSTAEVYREADRLGLARTAAELQALHAAVREADGAPGADFALWANDLQAACVSLRPSVDAVLGAIRDAGAPFSVVSGSGPTALGLFPGPMGPEAAETAAAALAARGIRAHAAVPVGPVAGAVRPNP